LQAQFSQIQKTEAAHKLSERNCIEIMLKLIDLGLIQVVRKWKENEITEMNEKEKGE